MATVALGRNMKTGRRSLRLPKVDSRLWFGLLLVAVSVLGGLRLFAVADNKVGVLVAARDLPGNKPLTKGDLRIARVQVGSRIFDRLLPATQLRSLTGRVLLYPVSKDGPVLETAIARSPRAGREISVPIASEHALGGAIRVGDRVDVLASFNKGSGDARTAVVVSKAEVIAINKTKGLFGQAGGSANAFTLSVDPETAVFLAYAMRNGELDIVRSTGADTKEPPSPEASSFDKKTLETKPAVSAGGTP